MRPIWPDDEWLDIGDHDLSVDPPSVTVDVSGPDVIGTILGPDGKPLHSVLAATPRFGFCR